MTQERYQFQPEEVKPKKTKVSFEKRHLLLALILIVLIIVSVAIASAMLSANHARSEEREKFRKLQQQGTSSTSHPTSKTTQPAIPTTPAGPKMPWDEIRLPRYIVPTHYDLSVKPFSNDLTFTGEQIAHFQLLNETSYILIHIKSLKIATASLKTEGGKDVDIKTSFSYPKNEYYVIETVNPMPKDSYLLTLIYNANISIALTGFYRSSYTTQAGEKKMLFTTKFQPTDARKAFPCFDEPDLKATYNVTVVHEAAFMARSNMPGITTVNGKDWMTTRFQKTVKMSSYLIAFVVSEFASVGGKSGINDNVQLSVWTHRDQIATAQYSLRIGRRMLTFLETFLDVAYPMPKLDMFAIPDYGSGATEHWGIITYRESRLLFKDGVSSMANKESIANIVSHELAHLWFGNLVTCAWWNDLWIQEGMASYLEYYINQDAEPTWKMMEQFITAEWKSGLDLDALASSHPISMPVKHPKQIKEIFDSITYRKGASILRMIDAYLGEMLFRQGLKNYLKTNEYKGATSDDFWEALKTNEVNVPEIMSTWTLQMGHPVVTFTKTADGKVTITQKHFLLDPDAKVDRISPFGYKWIVPLHYATKENASNWTEKKMLLKDTTAELTLPQGAIFKANFGQTGFFRTNYDANTWNELSQLLLTKHTDLSSSDRAGLIDDAFALARAGELDYSTSLNLTKYLSKESNYAVWYITLRNWKFIDSLLAATPFYGPFRKYVVAQLRPIVTQLGWDMVGTHLEKKQRVLLLSYACSFGDELALSKAKNLFDAWMNNNTKINPELQSLVLRYGVAEGGEREWNYVYEEFTQTTNSVEKSRLRTALGRTNVPWILRKWLSMSVDPNVIRSQDTVYVITGIASSNAVGKYVVWDFARANWEQLMVIMSANNFHVTQLTAGVTSQFQTEFELSQMKEFWKQKPNAGAQARLQGIEKVQGKIKWINKFSKKIGSWLSSQS